MVSIFKKFKASFDGLKQCFLDKSIRLQLIIAILVIGFGCVYSFTVDEWLWIMSCIFLVIICEVLNTAIEKVCDLIDLNINPRIKVIKDLSAAAVLLASIYSIVIGIMILKGVLR